MTRPAASAASSSEASKPAQRVLGDDGVLVLAEHVLDDFRPPNEPRRTAAPGAVSASSAVERVRVPQIRDLCDQQCSA